jgi:hypothetical protein
MTRPSVIELPRRLEPVSRDTFIDDLCHSRATDRPDVEPTRCFGKTVSLDSTAAPSPSYLAEGPA